MDKKKRDLIIAVVMVTLFIGSFVKNVLMAHKPAASSNAAAEETVNAPSPFNTVQFVTGLRGAEVLWESQRKYWDNEFGHDPFVPEVTATSSEVVKDLVLKGVFWDEKDPKAILNEKMVKTGDVISGYQVAEIRRKSVVLLAGDKKTELSLFHRPDA